LLINCAFVGQKNFDIIEMHGTTIKITGIPVLIGHTYFADRYLSILSLELGNKSSTCISILL
jgi:hypothetical protein